MQEKKPRGRPRKIQTETVVKRGRGRPRFSKYEPAHMVNVINKYLEDFSIDIDNYQEGKSIKIPFLEDCCNKNDWDFTTVSDKQRHEGYEELKKVIKKLHKLKEMILILGALNNKLNSTMVIFILKQAIHGYTDKQHHSLDIEEKLIQETKNHLKAIREGAVEADS